jgi:Secretion system C-terminal sorting domain/Fibronectin type III domain
VIVSNFYFLPFKNFIIMQTIVLKNWLKVFTLCVMVLGSISYSYSQCSQPSNLNSNVITGNTVSLSWATIPGALTYTVQYRVTGTTAWVNGGTVATSNQVITNLQSETVYQWRVRANCSTFSSIATFNSGGGVGGNTACSQPSNQTANVISTTSAELSWSAIEGALYYTIQYRRTGIATWTNGGSVTGLNVTVSNLALNSEYQWRVKASCSVYSSVATFNTGASGSGNSSCSQPSNTDAINIMTTSATLTWSSIQEAFSYTVEYRQGLAGNYINAGTVTGTSLTLTGLIAGTEYSWRVKASCSDFSSQAVFTTNGTGGNTGGTGSTSCSSPSNTNVVAIFSTSANIEWEPQGGAADYTVQYRLKNTFTYTTLGTFVGNAATLSGLSPNTEYEWRVKANCSPYGSDVSFTTTAAPMAYRVAVTPKKSVLTQKMSLYPNPAMNDEIQITTEMEGGQLQIMNNAGQIVLNKAINNKQENINISTLNNGLYIVKMQNATGATETVKLVVSH